MSLKYRARGGIGGLKSGAGKFAGEALEFGENAGKLTTILDNQIPAASLTTKEVGEKALASSVLHGGRDEFLDQVGGEIERLKAGPKPPKNPTSQAEIDNILSDELSNVKTSADPTHNSRIRTPGKTSISLSKSGTVSITRIEIGRQSLPGRGELIDTLLHEELEARIFKRKHTT